MFCGLWADRSNLKLCAEFVIEIEESQHETGSWREITGIPGNHHSALLKLHGHVDYRFRVSAINEVGRGLPSRATERYKTPASGIYKISCCSPNHVTSTDNSEPNFIAH